METKTLPSLLSLKVAPPTELQNQNVDNGVGEGESNSVKLPAALEQALAFKTERAKEVGGDPNDVVPVSKSPKDDGEDVPHIEDVITELETSTEKAEAKSNKTKKKKKSKRKRHNLEKKYTEQKKDNAEDNAKHKEDMPEIEYIQEIPSINDLEPMYRQFARVFEAFKLVEPEPSPNDAADKGEPIGQYPPVTSIQTTGNVPNKVPLLDDFDDEANQQQQQQGRDIYLCLYK